MRRCGLLQVKPSSSEITLEIELPAQPPIETVTKNNCKRPSAILAGTGLPSLAIYRDKPFSALTLSITTVGALQLDDLGSKTALLITTSLAPSRLPANQKARIAPSFNAIRDAACTEAALVSGNHVLIGLAIITLLGIL